MVVATLLVPSHDDKPVAVSSPVAHARDALSRDEFLPAELKAEMATKRKAVNETLGRDLSEAQQILTEIKGFLDFADTPITDADNQRFLQAMNLLDWKEEGSGDYKTRSPKRREPDYSQRLLAFADPRQPMPRKPKSKSRRTLIYGADRIGKSAWAAK